MKVTIQPGCISCGTCELIAPEVFVVEVTAQVRPGCWQRDCSQQGCPCERLKEKIRQAASQCPVAVIVIDDDGNKEK